MVEMDDLAQVPEGNVSQIRPYPSFFAHELDPEKDLVQNKFVSIASGGNGHFYEAVLVPNGTTWNEANNAANKMGGHLVTITSEYENEFVYGLVSNDDRFWIFDPGYVVGPWLGGLPE